MNEELNKNNMGLFDIAAVVLFITLLIRLRDNYLEKRKSSRAKDRSKLSPGERVKENFVQNPVTVGIFVAFLACLVYPIFFSGSSGPSIDARSMITLDVRSGMQAPNIVDIISTDSRKEYLLALVDIGASDSPTAKLEETCHSIIKSAALATPGLKGVIFGTIQGPKFYGEPHLAVDRAILGGLKAYGTSMQIHAIHGFGELSFEYHIREAAQSCFAEHSSCVSTLEGEPAPHARINDIVRAELLKVQARSCPPCGVEKGQSKSDGVDSSSEALKMVENEQESEKQQDVEIPRTQVKYERSPSSSSGGLSWVKMIFLSLTRILGFIYPLHETREALVSNNGKTLGAWRAYWFLYATIHFLEDLLFKDLEILMPVYVVAKIVFIGSLIYPGPDNALEVYSLMVSTAHNSPVGKYLSSHGTSDDASR